MSIIRIPYRSEFGGKKGYVKIIYNFYRSYMKMNLTFCVFCFILFFISDSTNDFMYFSLEFRAKWNFNYRFFAYSVSVLFMEYI